jgi:multisubunit Na+/H+ antiporter MnhB subunit
LRDQGIQEARPANQLAPVAILIVGIALVIVGQFFLDALSDTSVTWHWIQHGVMFAGGLAVGVSVTRLYIAGRGLA